MLETPEDVLISTANPWLNMSGGVNAAIREREPGIQQELRNYLNHINKKAVPAGSVVTTSAGSLPFSHIIHAVAIDPFYDSTIQIVAETLNAAFQSAVSLQARSISMPTLATGYGHLSVEDFAKALSGETPRWTDIAQLNVVVRSTHRAEVLRRLID